MDSKDVDFSRRSFLHTVGAGVPTLSLLSSDSAQGVGSPGGAAPTTGKFTSLDLGAAFNCSPQDFGPREAAREMGGASAADGLVRVPAGKQNLQGIPFLLGAGGIDKKSWLALSA